MMLFRRRLLNASSTSTRSIIDMIQRTLIKQSRSLAYVAKPAARTAWSKSRKQDIQSSVLFALRQPSRLYSSETEAQKEGEAVKDAAKEEDPLKKELEVKTKEAKEMKDNYLRSVAEFRNLQERTKRDVKNARDFALSQFAKDLVESVDNFDRALSMVPEEKLTSQQKEDAANKDLISLYDGLKMTESILMSTLKKHGLERFDPKGSPFNPNEHEATFMTAMKDLEDGSVFHTQTKGFKLNGRVLRAAKVGVVKNS